MIYRRIKEILRHGKITKSLYVYLWNIKEKHRRKVQNENIKANGIKTIHYLQSVLEKQNIQFFFDMGTLLGIIRENALLGHDIDIDIAFMTSDEKK